jgi:hypothetical protein
MSMPAPKKAELRRRHPEGSRSLMSIEVSETGEDDPQQRKHNDDARKFDATFNEINLR